MANKVWVLNSDDNNNYQCVIHVPTTIGNNSAGVSWANVLQAVGLNTTILTVGANGWQQLQAEHDAVVAGTTLEIVTTLKIDSANQTTAQVTALVAIAIADYLAKIARQYKWFGYNQAA